MNRVVITGLGLVSPLGLNKTATWKALLDGQTGVGSITAFDTSRSSVSIAAEVKGFDPATHFDYKEGKKATRFIQLALAASEEAISDAGLDLNGKTESYGCAIGVGIGGVGEIESSAIMMAQRGPSRISPFFIPFTIPNLAAGMVANRHNLKGPNICPATACTSGTHAIGEGYLYIQNGMADVMVCGGAESTVCEIVIGGFANMKALSRNNANPQQASRPFDKDRDGFILGEGAGVLVLESYEHAKQRGAHIYAEVLGYGMSADAHHITTPAPEGEGAQRCMKLALKSAGLNPSDIDYINAHGTSTYFNDKNETLAIKKVFGDHAYKLAVSSTKGATGHCLGAAGGIEACILALAVAESVLPPTLNLTNPDPECDLDYVPLTARPKKLRAALSNSFGFGGTNGSIVLGPLR